MSPITSKVSRVVSLLPSATEMLCIIGGEHLLVGRNHEDDFPSTITNRPILTGQKTTFTTSADVDKQVSQALAAGQSLYTLDTNLLEELKPQVVLTQDLCNVCAIDLQTVERVAQKMNPSPLVVTLNPVNLQDVLANIIEVGRAVGMEGEALDAKKSLESRVANATSLARSFLDAAHGIRKRVAFIEWTDPIYPGGHWTPQLIEMAGGTHPVAPATEDAGAGPSRRTPEQMVIDSKPEILIICPCGLNLEDSKRETRLAQEKNWWKEVMKTCKKVAVVDGNQMFNRPGPRLVDALEWLVGFIWDRPDLIPEGFPWEQWKQ
ncbi:uncharacterized protein SPPG_00943 [Spizellomyces punctatus DAOM BR117]|uniref:Fe/B12 periplasmic-binding domain-containing protein n=1 Tax=Spizellomyces punctatus (strain DAOM BR117) TaxID=645134 RepID=A0A0L0HR90_SPIPD|nr:uncharacterized protein SPPG_00943 [Spizellomyces punctatus DAOM BR117]KND03460.1 hypothetical protein SPPG_00943 [Spizellomyces punctatus DAOM BR117]|eukprot:XP_016611499.1 hypothetical protein SPPG_00943 [Spizellomyces punctatus DAOM BR117]